MSERYSQTGVSLPETIRTPGVKRPLKNNPDLDDLDAWFKITPAEQICQEAKSRSVEPSNELRSRYKAWFSVSNIEEYLNWVLRGKVDKDPSVSSKEKDIASLAGQYLHYLYIFLDMYSNGIKSEDEVLEAFPYRKKSDMSVIALMISLLDRDKNDGYFIKACDKAVDIEGKIINAGYDFLNCLWGIRSFVERDKFTEIEEGVYRKVEELAPLLISNFVDTEIYSRTESVSKDRLVVSYYELPVAIRIKDRMVTARIDRLSIFQDEDGNLKIAISDLKTGLEPSDLQKQYITEIQKGIFYYIGMMILKNQQSFIDKDTGKMKFKDKDLNGKKIGQLWLTNNIFSFNGKNLFELLPFVSVGYLYIQKHGCSSEILRMNKPQWRTFYQKMTRVLSLIDLDEESLKHFVKTGRFIPYFVQMPMSC